jgi:hypothetical protein
VDRPSRTSRLEFVMGPDEGRSGTPSVAHPRPSVVDLCEVVRRPWSLVAVATNDWLVNRREFSSNSAVPPVERQTNDHGSSGGTSADRLRPEGSLGERMPRREIRHNTTLQ